MFGDLIDVPARTKWLGIALVGLVGLLHLVETPEYFSEAAYIGVLFIVNAVGAAVAAYAIQRGQRVGWLLGLVVSGGAIVAYLVSRTVGLPSFHQTELLEPSGIVSVLIEGAFVLVAARTLRPSLAPLTRPRLS